jgi:hypothetical protein
MDSILTSIKKLLGPEEDDTHFDPDIVMHINTVFMALNQIGIGPEIGFSISDKTKTWVDYLGTNVNLEAAKSYIYLKVRLVFDPPSSTPLIEAIERQITELEWRLSIQPKGDAESG